jgi:hypothetical protein
LPAVLTDAQSKRYNAIEGFNTFYTRGTNGFTNNAPDTSTKFVLNYAQTAVVTPNSTGTDVVKLAWDFLQAEQVVLPVSSQDITVSGNTLTIRLTGSNALQVLGATYNVVFDAGFVQDNLNYQWPATNASTSTYTTPYINRPFIRIDKRVNEDRITAATGSATTPHLMAGFGRLLTTTARFDCRTPGSIVRYAALGQEHSATGATTDYNRTGYNWRNGGALNANPLDDADTVTYLTQQTLAETGTGGTNYTNFGNTITIGTTAGGANPTINNVQGYVWRVSARSRNSATGTNNSDLYEELAFRTVLTYELDNLMAQSGVGDILSNGDQLWIRGGDAISSSSIPGFPLTWNDDYGKLNTESKRAGIRLLQRVSFTTSMNNASVWRWVTWEVNVRTWHDVVMARGYAVNTAQEVNNAWQYGPIQWAYQTGGWTALKDDYTLYPGRHRWIRCNRQNYEPGGPIKWSLQFNTRNNPTTITAQQPNN